MMGTFGTDVSHSTRGSRDVDHHRIGILGKAEITAGRLQSDVCAGGWTAPAVGNTGICLNVHIGAAAGYRMRDADGEFACDHVTAGQIVAYDLRTEPAVRFVGRDDPITLTIPNTAIAAVADEMNAAPTGGLDLDRGRPFEDERLRSLASLLLYEDVSGSHCDRFFRDQIALALVVHLSIAHGAIVDISNIPRGGLAPWQVRRAKEMMTASLDRDIGLADVARQCGLSLSHFSRAFRNSLGSPPHEWLTHRRVDAARSMMRASPMPLCEVALACGFADQSHFTRVFSRQTGSSPGAWRRCAVS